MKFLFLLLICTNEFLINTYNADARRSTNKKRNNSCFADVVSRIASDMAKSAASEANRDGYDRYEQFPTENCEEKEELAEKTIEAASLAQANLDEKQSLVNKLTEEMKAIESVLHELFQSKRQLEEAIDKEMEAITDGNKLTEILKKALQLAKKIASNSDSVLSGVESNIRKTDDILRSESKELYDLNRKEHRAKADVEATRNSEKKALQAAIRAKENAGRRENEEVFKR
ncbi:hypothetical protein WA026_009703 [Henosepilachna vigintioctopunctata]|uniref:Uncharacterized protein n=1 Tax=Henosepilachna vigintioctopunctata TaxID=420089 RepID=A0AAW1U5G9_9CUCU